MTDGSSWVYCPGLHSNPLPPDEIGGKAYHLARLAASLHAAGSGAAAPPWVVVRASAFDRIAAGGRPPPATAEQAAERQSEVRAMELPAEFRAGLLAALAAARLRDVRL